MKTTRSNQLATFIDEAKISATLTAARAIRSWSGAR
jgi:hypothetical protein